MKSNGSAATRSQMLGNGRFFKKLHIATFLMRLAREQNFACLRAKTIATSYSAYRNYLMLPAFLSLTQLLSIEPAFDLILEDLRMLLP